MPLGRGSHPLMNLNDLDYRILYDIRRYFDIDRSWELLAGEIGYSTSQIQEIELELQRAGGSPTKKLLWDWGSRGATVKDLYDKLALINKVQCMRLLEHIVKPNKEKDKNKSSLPSSGSSLESKSDNLSNTAYCYDEESLPIPVMKKSDQVVKESNMPDENLDMSVSKPLKNDKLLGILDTQQVAAASGEIYNRKDLSATFKGEGAASSPVRSLDQLRSVLDEHGTNTMFSSQLSEEEKDISFALMSTKSYTYKELSTATEGFSVSKKLGQGKFGAVYFGLVKNTKCAIKRMLQRKQNGEINPAFEEASQLKALSKYRHEHIVNLYGYAIDNDCVYYVYEYLTNGSLHHNLHLRMNHVLTWEQRLIILRGAACGLQFLHTVESVPVIHGNIKSGNILLDRHFEAKIGDLGLAKQATGGDCPGQKTHITKQTTSVYDYQNQAYHPPEVMRGGGFSVKGDSYSFGVVIFECLTGQEAYDERREGNVEEKFLVEFIQSALHDSPKLDKQKTFKDPKQKTDFPVAIFDALFEVASKCTEEKKKDRPTVVEVYTQLDELEHESEGPEYRNIPNSPGKKFSKSQPEEGSIHEHRLTDMGLPSYTPGLKAPPVSKSQSKVPDSPIDMLPKDQPMPTPFKLQQEFDLRKGEKSYVNVDSITEQIKTTYLSDPKKLEAMEHFDRESHTAKLNTALYVNQVAHYPHGEPLENTEKFTQSVGQEAEGSFEYERAKDVTHVQGGEQNDERCDPAQTPSENYESLINEDSRPYGKIGDHGLEMMNAPGEDNDFAKELEEIADKAWSSSSMNQIFDRFYDIIQDENLINVPQEDLIGEDDEFNIQFDFETESEDSTITESINNDQEALNSADFNEDDLFVSEKHSYVNVPEDKHCVMNSEEKVLNMSIDDTLEKHQNKLARYQCMTREDSEELFERSAQPDDFENGAQGHSLPSQINCSGKRTGQSGAKFSSLPSLNKTCGCLNSKDVNQGQTLQSQNQGEMQGDGNHGNQVIQRGELSNIQEFLQRRQPAEGHCEEYV